MSLMRRWSGKGSSRNANNPQSPPNSYTTPMNNGAMNPGPASSHHGSRPASQATDSSFDFPSRPISHTIPTGNVGNLSRTDQIILRYFWESKYEDNSKRDLHYLKFPYFPQYPTHTDLVPYCEIYHLVKTSPGAKIISLGSANGVYIGFELFSGSQLHIDLDDTWPTTISHYRVNFRDYTTMVSDHKMAETFKTWPKPLTIEFLEDQYQKWTLDLMSPCWEGKEVRELGGGGGGNGNGGYEEGMNGTGHGAVQGMGGGHGGVVGGGGGGHGMSRGAYEKDEALLGHHGDDDDGADM